jgi:protein-serine/threonine kinase
MHLVGERKFFVVQLRNILSFYSNIVSGGELFDHILAHRHLKENEARAYFAQLISGTGTVARYLTLFHID